GRDVRALHEPALLSGLQVPARRAGHPAHRPAGSGGARSVRCHTRSVRLQPGDSLTAVRAGTARVRRSVPGAGHSQYRLLLGVQLPGLGRLFPSGLAAAPDPLGPPRDRVTAPQGHLPPDGVPDAGGARKADLIRPAPIPQSIVEKLSPPGPYLWGG